MASAGMLACSISTTVHGPDPEGGLSRAVSGAAAVAAAVGVVASVPVVAASRAPITAIILSGEGVPHPPAPPGVLLIYQV